MLVEFIDFQLEKSVNCTFDFIEIRLGIDESGMLFGRLCGSGHPGTIQATKSMWIWFRSDRSIAVRGFLASYTKTTIGK